MSDTNTKRIIVENRVECRCGPLVPNPKSAIGGKKTRRVRIFITGTVVGVLGKSSWSVRLDISSKIKGVKSSALKLVAQIVGIPVDEVNLNDVCILLLFKWFL